MAIEINGTKYRLNKRVAKAGELILLTSHDPSHELETVFIIKSSGLMAEDVRGNKYALSEYVVLESINSSVDEDVFIGAN
ncbi:hypothetical protein D3C71_1337820 [compost metagenome]